MVFTKYPDPTNITGAEGIMKYADNVTNGFAMIGFMVSAWIVMFVVLQNKMESLSNSVSISSFLMFILALLLQAIGLVTNFTAAYIFLGLTIIGIVAGFLMD